MGQERESVMDAKTRCARTWRGCEGFLWQVILTAPMERHSESGNSASLGFEPRQRDPESLVLPLHHEAIGGKANAKFANRKFEVSREYDELTRIS